MIVAVLDKEMVSRGYTIIDRWIFSVLEGGYRQVSHVTVSKNKEYFRSRNLGYTKINSEDGYIYFRKHESKFFKNAEVGNEFYKNLKADGYKRKEKESE